MDKDTALFPQYLSRLRSSLHPLDWYLFGITGIYTTLSILFFPWVPKAASIISVDLVFIAIVIVLALSVRKDSPGWLRIIRTLYVIPMIYTIYSQVQMLVPHLHWHLYDQQLIWLDRAIFGVNPTEFVDKISHPYLTEYLQLCYVSFYLMPCIHVIELYMAKRQKSMMEAGRLLLFSLFFSYVAYFACPAVGPRFTVHDFSKTNQELPGVSMTVAMREFVNVGGGIEPGMADPAMHVNRDCMPSGHTMVTLINILLAWRYRVKLRWLYTIIGVSLIFSTIYLRYHYAVDVVAGILCALVTLSLEPRVYQWLYKHRLIEQES